MLSTPEPSQDVQHRAFEYVAQWCAASREFVKKKVERWKLLEDLYHNRRELNSWGARTGSDCGAGRRGGLCGGTRDRERWQADIILAPSYIVDAWTDKAYQAIFSGPDWLTVLPDHARASASEELQFPASFKLQELLLARLSDGQIHVRLYEILQHLVLFGTVFAKVFWFTKQVTRTRWDYATLETVEEGDRVYDCPVVQVIPLDRVLVDWTATHSDVQRHSGIGHCVDKTYEHILEQFDRVVYHLNKKTFLERWKAAPASGPDDTRELLHDEDSEGLLSDELRRFTVWEWHGSIPHGNGHRESLCTIITERGADTPENGILVRLQEQPVLWSGLRPFLAAHYTPIPGPFGMGAVESNLDLIHAISQFLSQSQDNARLTANAQIMVRRGSSAARQISAENDVVYPGKVWTVDDPSDIQPFPPLNFPQQEVNRLIDYLNGLLERRSGATETTLGVTSRNKTATEAHILQESALGPFATRTDLFARSFLEPLGKLTLGMLQQFVLDDQTITVRSSAGLDVPVLVSAEEIQSGRFRVVATITRQDSTRIAKAQSIERVLPTLAQFQPLLAAEGVRISFAEMIKRYLDLIGMDGVDRVLSRIDPREAAQQGQVAPGPASMPGGPNGEDPNAIGSPAPEGRAAAPTLVEDGGPMGPVPTDANALAQLLQMQAQAGVGQA